MIVWAFCAPPLSSGVVAGLVQCQKWPIGFSPYSEWVDSEEVDGDFWGGKIEIFLTLWVISPLPPVWTGL
jgi:hypothetical protein